MHRCDHLKMGCTHIVVGLLVAFVLGVSHLRVVGSLCCLIMSVALSHVKWY